MKLNLEKILSKNKAADPDFKRIIIGLQIITLAALIFIIIVINTITSLAFATRVLSLLFVFILISLVMTIRGYLTPGRILVPIGVLAALTAILLHGNGLHDTAVVGFPVVLLLGGMMIGRKGLWPLALLCTVAIVYIGYAEITGLNTSPFGTSTGWDDVLINAALLTTSAGIMNLLMRQMEDTLAQARKNERELQLSEERFRVFMDTSPAIVIMKDAESRYLYCNNKLEDFLGRSVSEIIGKTEFDIFPKEEAEQFTKSDRQVLDSGKPITLEYSAHDLSGVMHDWWVFKFPMYSSNGKKYIGMQILDITERKRVEIALQNSEEIYRRAIATAGAVPYFLDRASMDYTFMGEGIEQMTGFSPSEITPEIWVSLEQEGIPRGGLLGMTYDEADKLTEEDITIPWECDYRILTRDGDTRWISDTSVKLVNEFGECLGVIGILQDITARKLAEIERDKLINDLEIRNAELERFTYTVSHDLKSPLVTIQGFLGLLEKDALAGDIQQLKHDSQRIKEATSKMQKLLAELLELSRIGRLMNRPEEAEFAEIVQEALKIVEGQIKNQGVEIIVANHFPAVYGDRARIVEVVQNLLDNACKYMGEQTQPNIKIGYEIAQDGKPVFYVRDNGMGIDPKFHERIFGLFNKLDPLTEGSGIGLALIKRIVEVHHGRIWVESDGPGKGSNFFFTLGSMDELQDQIPHHS